MIVVKRPQAMADLIETADYLAQDDPDIADRFFDSFEDTIERLKQNPQIGSIRRMKGISNLRMWFVLGFEKSLIFYTENNVEITIIRILHSSRDYTKFFNE